MNNMNNNMSGRNNRSRSGETRMALMCDIRETNFVLTELRLFLDTHPECSEALEMFAIYANQYKELVGRYESMYGPISSFSTDVGRGWQWNDAPMPWEGDRG